MKLLLTSNGINNEAIKNKLREMVGKDFSELKFAFIPTAMNSEPGDKTWFIDILNNAHGLGFKEFDIVEISGLDKKIWLSRLENADVIYCNGGSNFHLLKWVIKSGLADELPGLLEDRIWVGPDF
jgi:dipeptidase E